MSGKSVSKKEVFSTDEEITPIQYWSEKLLNLHPLQLPQRKTVPVDHKNGVKCLSFTLPDELIPKIEIYSDAQQIESSELLLSVFKALLYRYTASDDMAVAILDLYQSKSGKLDTRRTSDKVLIARTSIEQADSFRHLTERVKQVCREASSNSGISLSSLVATMENSNVNSFASFAPYLFQFQQLPHTLLPAIKTVTDKAHSFPTPAFFELSLCINLVQEQSQCYLSYAAELFETSDINRMQQHYVQLLESALLYPDKEINNLEYLSASEKNWLLNEQNYTYVEYDDTVSVEDIIWQQAGNIPEKIAVRSGKQSCSYKELTRRADCLASWLREQSVKPDDLVGIYLNRGIDLLVSMLAVMRAGAAYLPLDPAFPSERINYILGDAQTSLIITESSLRKELPVASTDTVVLDEQRVVIEKQKQNSEIQYAQPESLAYTIYTSGSTGRPKGVQLTRKNLRNFIVAMQQSPGLEEHDNLLAITTASFDIAVLELLLPLVCGASVTIAPREEVISGESLSRIINDNNISIMQATPATWRLLIEARWNGKSGFKALVGGEALPRDIIRPLLSCVDSLWNMYGPTETTVWSSLSRIQDADAPITIGRPIANTQMYILGQNDQPCPINVPGELCIAGDGAARGYANQPELTSEKFVTNPFSQATTRMYRTGDSVRWCESGEIEYLSRLDSQIKLRGYRIEPGEIEALLSQHALIAQSTVVVHTDKIQGSDLVAYLVCNGDKTATDKDLDLHLGKILPDYMVPRYYMWLDALPLTSNGKVDKKRLPDPQRREVTSSNKQRPETPTEKRIAKIWADLLSNTDIGTDDNFFSLGGHSLLAMRFIASARDELDFNIPVRAIMTSNLRQIARIISPKEFSENRQTSQRDNIEPVFFGDTISQLYGVLHSPPNSTKHKTPILICQPIGHEYVRSHRSLRILATELARIGHPVFRFDYSGTGDSSHSLKDILVVQWQQDIKSASEYLVQKFHVNKQHLIAVRFGVALALSTGIKSFRKVLFWDPVFDGNEHIEQLERFHRFALNDLDRYRWCQKKSPECELLGYQYSQALYKDIKQLSYSNQFKELDSTVLRVLSGEGSDNNATYVDDTQHWNRPEYMDDILLAYPAINAIIEKFH